MQIVPLDKKSHNRKSFDCGVKALNNYLRLMANQQSVKDNSRTYILEDEKKAGAIVGFYTLTMVNMDLNTLPKNLKNRHPQSYSARLIVHIAFKPATKRVCIRPPI